MEKKNTKLEALRIEKGYTCQQMADMLGVCKAQYWQLENMNRRLYYDTAKKIAAIFDLKPDEIFLEIINQKEA